MKSSKWVKAYAAIAVLTLVFQVYIRSQQCEGVAACGMSYAKAVAWAAVWPASWAVFLPGVM